MSYVSEYLSNLRKNLAHGDATEHTHRKALQHLVEQIAQGVDVINEAQRIRCGAPDFSLRRNKVPLAHIETKDIGTSLDEVEKGKGPHGHQFSRYKQGLPNWILTDYLRFDWIVRGEIRKTIVLASRSPSGDLELKDGAAEALEHLIAALVEPDVYTVETARDLATLMAGITHLLRDAINESFEGASQTVSHWLASWLSSFRDTLLPELKQDGFADMFAQTLAYGLFAARIQMTKSGEKFSYAEALLAVPRTNPLLRKLFSEMAGADMPSEFRWAVDDLVRLLQRADIPSILADFGRKTGSDDPVVHFYETFLAVYDPKLRKQRGVYYTPEAVVQYIVKSVDSLLVSRFGRAKGLADERTFVLDPASGTATFLYFVIRRIRERMAGQQGGWQDYVSRHLLNRVFGFELLMAPYAVAHLKLGIELESMSYSLGKENVSGCS